MQVLEKGKNSNGRDGANVERSAQSTDAKTLRDEETPSTLPPPFPTHLHSHMTVG